MARRYDDDDDEMDSGDLRAMTQRYSSIMREGASEEDLESAYEELGKADLPPIF